MNKPRTAFLGTLLEPKRWRNLFLALLDRHLIWLLLAAVVTAGVFLVPGFASLGNMLNVLWAGSPLACMVLGLFFVMLTAGLDLSLESTFAVAPTIAVLLATSWLAALVPGQLAVVATLVVGSLVGLLNGIVTVRLGVNPLLVTLATLLIFRGVVVYLIPEGVYSLPASYTFLGRTRIFDTVPVAILVVIALYALGYVITNHHSFGKSMYAVGNNDRAAFLAGVNVSRTRTLVFVFAGLFAAVGGLLEVGRLQSVNAEMGNGDVLLVFAAVILGGTRLTGGEGRVTGVLGAAILLAVVDNIMNLFGIEPSIRQMIFGLILLGAIYLASLQGRLRKAEQ